MGGARGGVPDIGGVGRDAQAGREIGKDRSILRGKGGGVSLYLCLEKDGWVVGRSDGRIGGMSVLSRTELSIMRSNHCMSLTALHAAHAQ